MTTTILPTRNTDWGFFGTIARIETSPATDPTKAWEMLPPHRRSDRASPEGVRDFLDSRHGRHFADDVANDLCTGEPLASRRSTPPSPAGMGWRIGRRTSRDEGIPRRASLPDGLGRPLRDPRRDGRLTGHRGPARPPRLRARLGVVAGSGWSRPSR